MYDPFGSCKFGGDNPNFFFLNANKKILFIIIITIKCIKIIYCTDSRGLSLTYY